MKPAILLAAMLLPSLAAAQVVRIPVQDVCAPGAYIPDLLREKYGEQPVWRGMAGPNGEAVAELWVADETWTFVIYFSTGMVCQKGSGTSWEDFERVRLEPQPEGDPA